MKKIFIKFISISILIISALIVILNTKELITNLSNFINYYNSLPKNIILIGILRILLIIIIIIYSLLVMIIQLRIIKNKEYELSKKIKVLIIIIPIIGLIIQIIDLSDFLNNIVLMILLITETIELVLLTKKKIFKKIQLFLLINYLLLILIIILFSYKFCHNYELPTINQGTSTKAVINKNIKNQIWHMSIEPEFFYNSFQNKSKKNNYNLIPIPGLSYTNTVTKNNSKRIETCTTMTPQGIVITDKYIYVSAYCYTHEHNSAIYQIDKNTKKLIKTIILPDTSHVGGLAYDDKNNILWIATKKYNTSKDDTTLSTVSCITQDVIDNYNFEIVKQPIRYNKTYQTAFSNTSFMTYHDGYLFTGLFSKDKKNASLTAKIKILEDGLTIDTEPINYFYIPNYVQSIAFIDNKILFTTSYGYNISKILVYEYNEDIINYIDSKPLKVITSFPMLEQIYPYNNELYMIFESSAYAYRYTPGIKIDHIVNLNQNILK